MDEERYFKTAHYSQDKKYASAIERLFHRGKESIISQSWKPLIVLARTTIVALMERITEGQLKVYSEQGIYTFGNKQLSPGIVLPEHPDQRELTAEIKVLNDAFWLRMLVLCDLGFSESYMAQDIEVDSLENVFKMFILNRRNLTEMDTSTSKIFSSLQYLMNSRFVNSISNSISNISAHYDISNDMFAAFLSPDMTYSCAIFPEISTPPVVHRTESESSVATAVSVDPSKEEDLEAAQMRKLRHIIKKARIRKDDRVLEIGTGWGSFAIEAVSSTGCQVDSLTLSIEQKQLAEARIAKAGLSDQIRVHLMDYRNIPKDWNAKFDRVVSIEMIEAVGLEFLELYFATVERVLKPDVGVAVFQVITIPESRFDRYRYEIDFIQKYIFPGGILPSVNFLQNALHKGSRHQLLMEQIENIGPHYAKTLREWRNKFVAAYESDIVPALQSAYGLTSKYDIEVFRRKWIYYFEYCAAGFALRVLGDHIFVVTREGNLTL